ncbi:GNAT family N-acetyltransferase [Photobacterium makurazakiensis]|uniref:GNAT family N-acetyltransferase n=1 Tax=Photobacterium makurazakiensis TaxID=2910234 RepID=UPI003D0B7463
MKYIDLESLKLNELVALLNECEVRTHLIQHDLYDEKSAQDWINSKLEINSLKGCYVRAIEIEGKLVGWCGIQPDDFGHEIAIVLQKNSWGVGATVFKDLMAKAQKMGLKEVALNLLNSRPKYVSLSRLASRVETRNVHGGCFTTYYISVPDA